MSFWLQWVPVLVPSPLICLARAAWREAAYSNAVCLEQLNTISLSTDSTVPHVVSRSKSNHTKPSSHASELESDRARTCQTCNANMQCWILKDVEGMMWWISIWSDSPGCEQSGFLPCQVSAGQGWICRWYSLQRGIQASMLCWPKLSGFSLVISCYSFLKYIVLFGRFVPVFSFCAASFWVSGHRQATIALVIWICLAQADCSIVILGPVLLKRVPQSQSLVNQHGSHDSLCLLYPQKSVWNIEKPSIYHCLCLRKYIYIIEVSHPL